MMCAHTLPTQALAAPQITMIIGGSMAAVKAPSTLRRLREKGALVRAITTQSALEFITELSLTTAADFPVATDQSWFESKPTAEHLTLAKADMVVVLSASADLLARAAGGHASDLASATLLSVRTPVLWVPAMNEQMWLHPAVQANVQTLRSWGHHFLGPEVGQFGTQSEGQGLGRMAEPEDIAEQVMTLLNNPTTQTPTQSQDLAELKVVISAGPTREYLDPVRFISNPSSGKMGFAIAMAARDRGAKVTLVRGPVNLPDPSDMQVIKIESALELQAAMTKTASDADLVVMTAAVADYRAAQQKTEKEAKTSGDVSIALTPNPDILAGLGTEQHQHPQRTLVGFAMETHAGVERAAQKAKRKNADFILLNYPTQSGTAFGGDDNQVTLVKASGEHEEWPRMSKRAVAERLLDEVMRLRT